MTSFFTALSALQAQQNWIELLGNNLANSNTPGFKGSYATFADQFSQTLRYGSAPGNGLGGTNPSQVGLGVRLANVGRDFQQGALSTTGRAFDLAIEGRSFFALSDGQRTLYTRVGSFGLDAGGNLVDQRSGLRVLGASGAPITIDANSRLAPKATATMSVSGNLPKTVTGPKPEILATSGLAEGTQATLTGSLAGPFTIPAGETWTLRVRVGGGAAQTASVTSTTGTVTAADIASAIDGLNGVSATVDGSGHVAITTDHKGASATIDVDPGAGGHDLAALAGLSTTLVAGTETSATVATDLSQLTANGVPYQAGDQIRISGVDADGSSVSGLFTYGAANDGTTVQDLVTFLDGLYQSSTVALDADGNITVTADDAGTAATQLVLSDASGNVGQTEWTDVPFSTIQQGAEPDTVTSSTQLYDASGSAHVVTWTFERQADNTWNATASMDAADGVVLSPPITGIAFSDDGTPQGFDGLDSTLSVRFAGQTGVQDVDVTLGTDGQIDGLTQFGSGGSALVSEQDGYAAGEITSMSVDQNGHVNGFYSNGHTEVIASVGVATFANPEGLNDIGGGMFSVGSNSGIPVLGEGNQNGAGRVLGGTLEGSNVDTASQLVLLIEAQRGYQANARVVTAQDEVLRTTVQMT